MQTGTAGPDKKPLSTAAPGPRFSEPAPNTPWEQAGTRIKCQELHPQIQRTGNIAVLEGFHGG